MLLQLCTKLMRQLILNWSKHFQIKVYIFIRQFVTLAKLVEITNHFLQFSFSNIYSMDFNILAGHHTAIQSWQLS